MVALGQWTRVGVIYTVVELGQRDGKFISVEVLGLLFSETIAGGTNVRLAP